MTRSYHTEPEEVIAKRRAQRHQDGTIALPRIALCKPAPGDIHPLEKKPLRGVLRRVPEKYLYGLKQIELRARPGNIGNPFGLYRPREKTIILYSLPLEWHLEQAGSWLRESLRLFYANVDESEDGLRVSWLNQEIMSFWFFMEVLAHELGHHHVEQYRAKNSRVGGWNHEEFIADLHAIRIQRAELRRFRQRKGGESA